MSPCSLELACSTMAGNIVATLEWQDDAPATALAEAIVVAVRSSVEFSALNRPTPLGAWNLRLLKPDGSRLALSVEAPSLPEQFGL